MSYKQITINGCQVTLIPLGHCHCGCGELTKISPKTDRRAKHVKGRPLKYLFVHAKTAKSGQDHPNWKGGNHIFAAKEALGKSLPIGAVVHHYTPEQLVICQDQSYHMLLHKRQRAYEASGHADWLQCTYCHQFDSPENIYEQHGKNQSDYHPACRLAYKRRHAPEYRDRRQELRRKRYAEFRAQGLTWREAKSKI